MAESSIGRDWIMVRIERGTHRQLRELAATWDRLYAEGRLDVPHSPDGQLSINAIVAELLRRDQDHRDRSRSNSGPRRGKAGRPHPDGPWDESGKLRDS